MPLKREPCRNFQRGSCRYGDKCKFLHVTQQQPKSNAFGFGSQNASSLQQQKPNPFGFGVQNSGATGAAKPFENKWVREQPSNQSQAANHKCTDPEACKRQIAEDLQNERPLWKLTCYGHSKSSPCDITGDISYEELRALAYDEAKRGISLQSIVERERSLVNSKLIEFQNLLQNPYTMHTPPSQSNQNSFPAVGGSSPFPTQNSSPPFQQSPPPNMSFGVRPSAPSTTGFGQFQGNAGPFGSNSVPSGPFGVPAPTQTGGNMLAPNIPGFGNSGINSQPTHPAQTGGNTFTPNGAAFGNFGANNQGPQVPVQTGGFPFTSNLGGFGNAGFSSQESQISSTSPVSLPTQTLLVNNSFMSNSNAANGGQQIVEKNLQEASSTDASIWLKEEWKLGEIPEQPPPAAYVR